MQFVNRDRELNALERWWAKPEPSMGIVWGRRRMGKTALIKRFARSRRSVYHLAAGRPPDMELLELSRAAAAIPDGPRDLASSPFASWDEVFDWLGTVARSEPLLFVLDEFPELMPGTPWLTGYMRAVWERLVRSTRLKILVAGSAVRAMWRMQEYREPLYGRFDLQLRLDPFWPDEAAQMLPRLAAADRARVWGIVGGTPRYLQLWDQERSVAENVELLACQPTGELFSEGVLVLATELEDGDLGRRALYAIANGRTRPNEIETALGQDPARTLERLEELRLIERVVSVTDGERFTRRRLYRVADNFLAFWLGVLDHYRAEIEAGIGDTIVEALMRRLDDFMGARWEEAFRMHLRRMTRDGVLAPDVVAIGPFWAAGDDPAQMDAVVLAGVERRTILVGEAKWAKRVDGERLRRQLERKAAALPGGAPENLRYAVCAREVVANAGGVLAITAADIFDG